MAVWRDISLLWLMFLTLIAVLPWGILFFFGIMGLNKVRQVLKKFFPVVQLKFRQVASGTEQISYKIAQPVVSVNATGARVGAMTQSVTRNISRRTQA